MILLDLLVLQTIIKDWKEKSSRIRKKKVS